MVARLESIEITNVNPLDLLEQAASVQEWPFERTAEDEINLNVTGRWCDYHLSFTWRQDLEALHVSAAFDMRVPKEKRSEIYALLGLVNEQMWLGHFDLWQDEGVILFRHGILFQGGATFSPTQIESLVHIAVDACERFYPAFQFVIWAGKKPEEAMAAAMLECVGQA